MSTGKIKARLSVLNKNEICAFLGCKNNVIPQEISNAVDECILKLSEICTPVVSYKIFDTDSDYIKDHILIGEDVKHLLKSCKKTVLFAATLGSFTDTLSSRLQISDMSKAVVFDACASSAVENICDNFCDDISKEYGFITRRFSAGYGDFPISMQKKFASVLDLQKTAGITFTDSGLMLPQKSVTALFGISDTEQSKSAIRCKGCRIYESCNLRKEDKTCE